MRERPRAPSSHKFSNAQERASVFHSLIYSVVHSFSNIYEVPTEPPSRQVSLNAKASLILERMVYYSCLSTQSSQKQFKSLWVRLLQPWASSSNVLQVSEWISLQKPSRNHPHSSPGPVVWAKPLYISAGATFQKYFLQSMAGILHFRKKRG